MQEDVLRSIAAFIKENDGFTVIAHTSPDGDTLGASLALYGTLKRMGKRAEIVCEQPVPHVYAFLPGADAICLPEQAVGMENAIAVDCADLARMGAAGRLFQAAKRTCNIDHHITNDSYAAFNAVDAEAAATGEIIAALAALLLPKIDDAIATCLYTALLTDTGNASYCCGFARLRRGQHRNQPADIPHGAFRKTEAFGARARSYGALLRRKAGHFLCDACGFCRDGRKRRGYGRRD